MPSLTVNFTEASPAPSNGYQVKYRKVGDPTYTTVSPNPTSSPVVIPITDPTVDYEGTIQSICGATNGTLQGFSAAACTCDAGYTITVDGSACFKYNTTAPDVSHSDYCLAASKNAAYSQYGTRIYAPGFTSADISTDTPSHIAALMNIAGYWQGGTSTTGPMNRAGVWIDSDCDGTPNSLTSGAQTTISYAYVNSTGAPKTIYIGVGGDNQFVLQINGTIIAQTLGPTTPENFRWWHIFPYTAQPGNNLINLVGTGDGTVNDSVGMIIYDNTQSQLQAATSDASLNIIFTTEDLVGDHIDVATCPAGYDLDTSGGAGNYTCKQLVTTALDCSGTPVDPPDPTIYTLHTASTSYGPATASCFYGSLGSFNYTVYCTAKPPVVGATVYTDAAGTIPTGILSFCEQDDPTTYFFVPAFNGGVITETGTCTG